MSTASQVAPGRGGNPDRRPYLVRETPVRWRIEPTGRMRVPGIVFASRRLLADMAEDQSLRQVANVATLPGIVRASYAMPDVHWGYGFPIGGVAATDVDDGGVVSPGGVGFDISCGVRLLVSGLDRDRLAGRLQALMDALDRLVPRGLGGRGLWRLTGADRLRPILTGGAVYAVERGHGVPGDLARCEDGGGVGDADPTQVSDHARARGLHQVGSLGSGNHFLEIQAVDRIYDSAAAEAFGLTVGRVCVMIHSGSRGLGHQVCSALVADQRRTRSRRSAVIRSGSSAGRESSATAGGSHSPSQRTRTRADPSVPAGSAGREAGHRRIAVAELE